MVRSRSSTQRHQRHTPARLAWRRKSPTAARCAASATRIWTDSSTINRTHHPATRISSLEVVTSPLAVESCKGRTSTLLELASLELAKKAFCEPVNKYVIMSIHKFPANWRERSRRLSGVGALLHTHDVMIWVRWLWSYCFSFFSLRKWFPLAYLLTGLCGALLLFILLSGRSYWHDCFTTTLDIPRRFQILSTWPGNRAILERSRPPLSKELSRRNCLHLPAFTLCSSCFASSYGIRVFHGR